MNAQVKRSLPKAKKEVTQVPVSFGAYPEEIERWKAAAREVDRPLSYWIRNRLLSMDERDAAAVTGHDEASVSRERA